MRIINPFYLQRINHEGEPDTFDYNVSLKEKELQRLNEQINQSRERTKKRIKESKEKIAEMYIRIEKLLRNNEQSQPLDEALTHGEQANHAFGSLRIGERLLIRGAITAEQLNQALEDQSRHGGRIGDTLVHLGYVTRDQVEQILDQSFRRLLLGEQLVQSGDLRREELQKALRYQEKIGGDIGEILLSMNLITQNQLYGALAVQNQVGRLISYNKYDAEKNKIPKGLASQYHAIVISRSVERCVIAVETLLNSKQLSTLSKQLDVPVTQVLASPWEMEDMWGDIYKKEFLNESTDKLKNEQPENSASETFTLSQIVCMIILSIMIAASLLWNWFYTLVIINIIIQLVYFGMSITKFVLILYGTRETAQLRITDEEIAAINERDLPMYTILVPMYKESNVIPKLVTNLSQLDYPKNKLDIRLLIEQDDVEAQQVIQSMNLPLYFQTIVVPDGQPKTKPKACNYGLIRARGDYIVIYDAEDQPDRDQLKKVFLAFQKSPESTACIQAKLNYFNSDQNLLTRFFTQEYSNWFELMLPGVMQINVPIPLGGTSNHFKTDVLKKLGAWDPYNVTEDADLGIRLYKQKYTTKVVDSRTLEEANSRSRNWIRQRSRWIKGYMQTWLVHMRHPLRLRKELGFKGFWGAQFMLLSSPLLPMLNPIFWSLLVLWYATHAGWIHDFFPGAIYYLAAVQLIIGNFLFIYTNMAGTYWVVHDLYRKKETWLSYGLVKYALFTPIYWVMMSIASLKALWQLIRKPFYWEKTVHGFDTQSHSTPSSGEKIQV
ncbi:glycosyltransferase family 2 protein [Sporolactobacillus pectinivorans]|uniref:glycosyltransferase family 2 protein n=1 Tax=Sporolactobacillus pectinivorans TaxID=1591408 RepID=UPI001EFC510C|nr:glycosyltransferase family 2 protein [Sporolactobacillus pectinivorans]